MRKYWPFIAEFLILLFCVAAVVAGLVITDLFSLSIRPHLLIFVACMMVIIGCAWLFLPVVRRGVMALLDAVSGCTVQASGKVVDVLPLPGGIFSEKWGEGHQTVTPMRYVYVLDIKGDHVSLIAGEYVPYDENKQYTATYGPRSGILLFLSEWGGEEEKAKKAKPAMA